MPPEHIKGFIIESWTGEVSFRCNELGDTFGLIFFQQICVFISIGARREVSEGALVFFSATCIARWILVGQTLKNRDALLEQLVRDHGEHGEAFR